MICFAWDGFPQYAARCIGAFVNSTKESVVVVATKPTVPINGMAELCGCQIEWIERDESCAIEELVGEVPRCIFLGGWNIPSFNRFRDEVRQTGGRTIGMCDNNFNLSMKECLKAVRFRMFLRNKYDGFLVPGNSGIQLLRFYGVPRKRIATGMYSADATLFKNGLPLEQREKKIIYVGQFIERKNVLRLVEAFTSAAVKTDGGWTLDLYGSGVLKDELIRRSKLANEQLISVKCKVGVHDFIQPEQLSALYRSARIFCLPSLSEHWGLVVHEAALSGCVLVLGDKIGAGEDLFVEAEDGAGYVNGFDFDPKKKRDMAYALLRAMRMSDEALRYANTVSLEIAKSVSIESFVKGVHALANGVDDNIDVEE